MTNKEMQRYLIKELERGCSELEAYRNLMEILDIKLPLDKESTDSQS